MQLQRHPWSNCRFIVKLDPDRTVPAAAWQQLQEAEPDLVLVGGTERITYAKVADLLGLIALHLPVPPIWQEISDPHCVYPGLAGYAVPCVINSASPEWMIGAHAEAIDRFGDLIPWQSIVVEGYLILNPDAAVAKLTNAIPLPDSLALAYAQAAQTIWNLQTLYVEYSGRWGDIELLHKLSERFRGHLIYGGGVDSVERASACASGSDSVIIGNAVYETQRDSLAELATAIRSAAPSRSARLLSEV
ncbi:MAG: geranylgeranylglyceryl/heptaprenylglyceryl phosphate synthase [Bacilli bacterium]|nr:geranylgeranylglyceryl/heptaprenylglyceryl phosphate synthase [Bacilli bacterium]